MSIDSIKTDNSRSTTQSSTYGGNANSADNLALSIFAPAGTGNFDIGDKFSITNVNSGSLSAASYPGSGKSENDIKKYKKEIENLNKKITKKNNEIEKLKASIKKESDLNKKSEMRRKLAKPKGELRNLSSQLASAKNNLNAASGVQATESSYSYDDPLMEELFSEQDAAKAAGSGEVDPTKELNLPRSNVTELSSREEFAEYGFDDDEKIRRFHMLVPEMQTEVLNMIDYAKSNGLKISFDNPQCIVRTYDEQVAIYNRNRGTGYAAVPGNSQHEKGKAIDITIAGANMENPNDPKCKLLADYWTKRGYTWGGKWEACEPWHFDLRPLGK